MNPVRSRFIYIAMISGCLFGLSGCRQEKEQPGPVMFEGLEATHTGLDFTNKLTPTQDFNVF